MVACRLIYSVLTMFCSRSEKVSVSLMVRDVSIYENLTDFETTGSVEEVHILLCYCLRYSDSDIGTETKGIFPL